MTRRNDRNRRLKPDELHLWRQVAASVTPLGPASEKIPSQKTPQKTPEKPSSPAVRSLRNTAPLLEVSKPKRSAAKAAPARLAPDPPPLTGLERGLSRRLARGRVEIDARLDLHGYRREAAYGALQAFLAKARARGARCVLVITGKGQGQTGHTLHGHQHYHTPERTSILRRQVPLWLEEAALRVHVAGYQPAHPRHGGGGAFYVWLRRHRP